MNDYIIIEDLLIDDSKHLKVSLAFDVITLEVIACRVVLTIIVSEVLL